MYKFLFVASLFTITTTLNLHSVEVKQVPVPVDHPAETPTAIDVQVTQYQTTTDEDNRNYNTLVEAIMASDLGSVFQSTGYVTIFAPTNEAFKKLDPEKRKELFKPKNKDKLAALLTYHIIPEQVDLTKDGSVTVKTANGKEITIEVNGDEITVNDAKVLKKDEFGSKGVIYTIDTVLIP